MADADPFEASMRGVGVTIKYGDGFDAPWLTVRGDVGEVIDQLVEAYSLDFDESVEPDLNLVIIKAADTAKAHANLAGIGAKPRGGQRYGNGYSKGSSTTSTPKADEAQAATTDGGPWAGVETPAEPEDPNAALIQSFQAIQTRKDMKNFYADNLATFQASPELTAAWKEHASTLPKDS